MALKVSICSGFHNDCILCSELICHDKPDNMIMPDPLENVNLLFDLAPCSFPILGVIEYD
jgi:hypothetical protein